LKTEWNRATREDDYLGLILLDVDYFKKYNDTYGHQAGDVFLKQIAACMVECLLRPADLVARYGGEGFVVILPSTSPSGVKSLAEQINHCIENLKIDHSGNLASNFVTASLGAAFVESHFQKSLMSTSLPLQMLLYIKQKIKEETDFNILNVMKS
jgi:diguanylate cyclase (GGDEF)-like protein